MLCPICKNKAVSTGKATYQCPAHPLMMIVNEDELFRGVGLT